MKKKKIEIFLFIDALGWKIVNEHRFLTEFLPHRKKITMQYGYSSTAIPTILSGKTPAEHGHLGLFRFDKENSPFKFLSKLAFLFKPDSLWNRGRVRHHLSKIIKKLYGFTGYFQLYRMPIWKLKYVDYCEKENLFVKKGMGNIPNLYDTLDELEVKFHISDWHLSDNENYLEAEKAITEGKEFLFVYTASFDGLLHDKIGDYEVIHAKLDEMAKQITSLYNKGLEFAEEVNFCIISDHGMTPLKAKVDIMQEFEKVDLVFGRDYGACFDSTMARFYYLNDRAEEVIVNLMQKYPGHFLSKDEELKYGIYRADRLFGNGIFLLDAGVQIVPSDMGDKPLMGMHGFAPEDEDSHAVILSNSEIDENVEKVADYFEFMIERAKKL